MTVLATVALLCRYILHAELSTPGRLPTRDRVPRVDLQLVEYLPRGNSERAEQLVRSAESVVRNIAEGAGRWSEADSRSRYKIARGEAMECAASLDVMRLRKLVTEAGYEQGIRLLEGVVAMLTKMF